MTLRASYEGLLKVVRGKLGKKGGGTCLPLAGFTSFGNSASVIADIYLSFQSSQNISNNGESTKQCCGNNCTAFE